MKLAVSQLSEGTNTFRFTSTRDLWLRESMQRLKKQGYEFTSNFEFDLVLIKLEPDFYLRGKLATTIRQPCARCVEDVELEIEHPFELALTHVNARSRVKGSSSNESEGIDVNYFTGPELDLTPLVDEQFFFGIPYQVLCRPDCRGICQKCGKNMNLASCQCQSEKEAGRFSVLEQVKL